MRITSYKTMLKQDVRIPELVKEKSFNYETDRKQLDNPGAITEMLNTVFSHGLETEEVVYLICFDTKIKPVGVMQISRGTVNLSCLNPREILIKALMCGAVNIAIAHNHPSGDCLPSNSDIESSKRLLESCKIIGLKLLDSIVLTSDNYISLRQENLL